MPSDRTFHDGDTLRKAYEAMHTAGLKDQEIVDALNEMQNSGLLIREKSPWGVVGGQPHRSVSLAELRDQKDGQLELQLVVDDINQALATRRNVFEDNPPENIGRQVDRKL